MAKTTTTITNKQSEQTEIPVGYFSTLKPSRSKVKYLLLNQEGKIVASLIDRAIAEKWIADHRFGAVKFIENNA